MNDLHKAMLRISDKVAGEILEKSGFAGSKRPRHLTMAEAEALMRCIRKGILDRTPQPPKPLDIMAQQIVAACVAHTIS